MTEAGRRVRLPASRALARRVRGDDRACPPTTRSIATCSSASSRRRGSPRPSSARTLANPARVDLPPRRRPVRARSAREFAPLADRLASVAGRLERLPRLLDAARTVLVGHGDRARSAGSRPRRRSASWRGSGAHRRRRCAAAARPGLRRGRGALRRASPPPPRLAARGRRRRFETHLRDVVLPASEGEGRLGPSSSPRRCATRCARRTSRRTGSWPRPSASSPAVRGRDGPPRPRAVADWCPDEPLPGRRGPRWSAASSTRSPSSIREADDLLDFCREENARIEAFCAERDLIGLADEPLDPLDAGLPAVVRRRDALVAGSARQGPEGVLRRSPRCPTTGPRSSASRTCARTTTGCSAC